MMDKLVKFIKYNNLTAIIFSVVFGGMSVSLAANPAVRGSVYSSSQTVKSVDNTLLLATNVDNFNFNLRISEVRQDKDNYYVSYSYNTLQIEDSVWKQKTLSKTFQIAKLAIEGKDLGLYVAKQLSDNINAEIEYLKRVQEIEKKKGKTNKVVAVEYSGLVGKFIDTDEKVIQGYVPVVEEVVEEEAPIAEVEENKEEVELPPVDSKQLEPPSQGAPTIDDALIKRMVDEYLASHPELIQNKTVDTDDQSNTDDTQDDDTTDDNTTPVDSTPPVDPANPIDSVDNPPADQPADLSDQEDNTPSPTPPVDQALVETNTAPSEQSANQDPAAVP